MKTVTIQIEIFNLKIEHSVFLFDLVKAMPPALRIETIIELFETIEDKEHLEPFQKAIFKNRISRINKILSTHQ